MNYSKLKVTEIVPSDVDPSDALIYFDDGNYIVINADQMEAIKEYYEED